MLITLGICRQGQVIGKNKEILWVLEACEGLVGTWRKKMRVLLGRRRVLEAWSVCTKDLNGSKRVFNINFVET